MKESRAEMLPMADLRRCPIQLRTVKKETLEYYVLRDSVRDRGLLTPLLVRPILGGYEVVDGANRFEILLDLRKESVPCNIMELSDQEVLEIQIEAHGNIPTKMVEYATRLWQITKVDQTLTIQELAYGIHRTVDWVKRTLTLVNLSPLCKQAVDGGRLPVYLAIELAKLPPTTQDSLLELLGTMPNKDFKILVQDKARQFRQGVKDDRIEKQMVDRENNRGLIRDFREVENELNEPTVAASVLLAAKAETQLEIWRAALKWVLRKPLIGENDGQDNC